MKRTTKRVGKKASITLVHRDDRKGLLAYVAEHGQLLRPMLELITGAKETIDSVMAQAGRAVVELLLVLSAQQVAGEKRPGRRSGEIIWHGSQPGRICLAERKLKVSRPRLRTRGPQSKEVAVPAYERLGNDARLSARIQDILVAGVSTRKYGRVLPEMADSVGISKSQVSREFVLASEKALAGLMERRFDEVDLLAIYIDGIVVDEHHVVAAVGVDEAGEKHLLGLAQGASENAAVVTDLLTSLVERGVKPDRRRLFVIDGAKALRAAINAVFGEAGVIQRCRTHKIRNVTERLPEPIRSQVKAVMHAAYQLPQKEGIAKLKQQAQWLKSDYPDAAASLLEGLEETFTVNRLRLTPALMRCLVTTNLIENPNGCVRRITNKVSRWRDGKMVLRWVATGFLEAEKSFRKIQGYRDLWVLKTALRRGDSSEQFDEKTSAA